jgi:hypothetical protein
MDNLGDWKVDACLQVISNPLKDFGAITIKNLDRLFVKEVNMGTEVKSLVQGFPRCWERGRHLRLVAEG